MYGFTNLLWYNIWEKGIIQTFCSVEASFVVLIIYICFYIWIHLV